MRIAGISKIVSNQNSKEIMSFWENFFQRDVSSIIPNKTSLCIFCVYTDYEGDYRAPYKMIIGHEVEDFSHIPGHLETIEFNYDTHTQYTVKGELPKVVMEKWQHIWDSNHPRAYKTDFQRHNLDGSVDIFVEHE